ncbi:MAG: hypothetical protein JWO31_2953, partial [Phycisphaerales bacterium]|nr:hypothetical protein [Phycisphaerales bacterium]
LYACGVMLYEMLTGEKPAGTDLPSAVNPAVPRHLDEVFRRSYARLDKRYASADEMAKALTAGPPAVPASAGRAGVPGAAPFSGYVPPNGSGRGVGVPALPPVMPPPLGLAGGRDVGRRSTCPQCRGAVDPTDQFCMHCGVQMVENVRRCPQCGGYPDPTDTYCIFCGQGLTAMAGVG